MNRNKVYIIFIIGLLASNIMLVSWLLLRKDHMRPQPKEIIIEKLHFDNEQIRKYQDLINDHRSKIPEKEQELMKLKNDLYATLKDGAAATNTDSLIMEIGKVHSEIERIHLNHFQDIKKICRDDQMDEFDELVNELSKIFSPPPMKKEPR